MSTQLNDAEAPRTVAAKSEPNKLKRIFKILGPGLTTGASDDDPSGIVTYAQAGAQFGLMPLWTALFTFPLMSAVQYMCSKIGLVTGKGLAQVMLEHYPRWILYVSVFLLVIANTVNAGADIGAIGSGLHLIFPAISPTLITVPVAALIIIFLVKGSYKQIAEVFKWLSLALFGYIIAAALTHPNWIEVAKNAFIPHIDWNKKYLLLMVAILGTTISPYLFFWQAELEVEEQREEGVLNEGASRDDLKYAAIDVNAGMLFSNVVMFFIVLASATTLHVKHITEVTSAQQAASALTPFAGPFASYLFAAGLIGTGFLAVPVLVGSSAYALSTAFGWNGRLNKKWHEAKPFYAVIGVSLLIGMGLNFLKINAMAMLYWTAIINGLLAPPLLFILMFISNNSKIMGKRTNSPLINVLGWLATVVMTIAAGALIVTSIPGL